jgi:uroporphyrinogen decarboxylase
MRHRDRVRMVLQHEQPDRCPMYVGFTPEFRAHLRNDMQIRGYDLCGDDSTYEIERALDEDMLLAFVGWALSYYQEGESYVDEWGVRWKSVPYKTRYGTGRYTEMIEHPLADQSVLDHYQPPDPTRPELYANAEKAIREFKDEYWIVGAVVCTILETAWGLRGLEAMMLDFAVDPDLVERILDIPFHYHLTCAKRLVEMGVDMIWIGDDVGTQHSMLISPIHWRRFLKPRMATFIAELKAINPEIKIAYHSDGYLYPIIGDLIEIGLDVLNPIQPASMDPAKLKREFGDRLCFWGSVDLQRTLPFGTPAEVRAEVLERLRTIGKDGGLIIGPTHYVQLDTPLENFWTMIEAITSTPYAAL